MVRNCGWLPKAEETTEQRGTRKIVWARGNASTEECPVSYISPQSIEWLEKFFAWKTGGAEHLRGAAKDVDALLLLQKEWQELKNGIQ